MLIWTRVRPAKLELDAHVAGRLEMEPELGHKLQLGRAWPEFQTDPELAIGRGRAL